MLIHLYKFHSITGRLPLVTVQYNIITVIKHYPLVLNYVNLNVKHVKPNRVFLKITEPISCKEFPFKSFVPVCTL